MQTKNKLNLTEAMREEGIVEVLSEMSSLLSQTPYTTKAISKMCRILDGTAYAILNTLDNPRDFKPSVSKFSESFYEKARV